MARPAATTPTADLYFRHAHARELRLGRLEDGTPLNDHGPGLVSLGEPPHAWIVLRGASARALETVRRVRPGRLLVLIDDDIPGVVADGGQPLAYRWRQWRGWRNLRPLLRTASCVLAPSDALLERLRAAAPNATLRRIDPALLHPLPPLDHHGEDGAIILLISDTRSHRADIAEVAPAIRRAMDREPRLRLVTFLGDRAPAALRHPRARHRSPLPWPVFRERMGELRAHVLLAPRRPTPVNAARSSTRLLDAAMAGAAGLYGRVPAIGDAAPELPDWTLGAVDWEGAILRLARDHSLRAELAGRTAAAARRIGNAERQRAAWRDALREAMP